MSPPIDQSDYAATGLKWIFYWDASLTFLYDTHLSFGGRRSPDVFHHLTQSVKTLDVLHMF